jgi:hypothetical protein
MLPHQEALTLRRMICMTLLVVLVVSCLVVGCGKRKVSEEPDADQQKLGKDLINKAGGSGAPATAPAPAPEPAEDE